MHLLLHEHPEKGQPYGQKAKQALADIIFQQNVKVEQIDIDRYGRVVGKVYKDGKYVNRMLVAMGAAWVYRKYSDDPALLALETEARDKNVGLWKLSEAERTPPWEWRRLDRKKRIASLGQYQQVSAASNAERGNSVHTAQMAPSTNQSCGTKKTCGQMSSCSEARFYLTQCDLSRLDRDNDGIPCESICK